MPDNQSIQNYNINNAYFVEKRIRKKNRYSGLNGAKSGVFGVKF